MAAAGLLACSLFPAPRASAQTVASVLAAGEAADPAPGPRVYPLSGVHRGQRGTAYTVLQGSTPEALGVKILGVLHNAIGPGKDMILAQLTGSKAQAAGVAAGMSGSPVYIDGRLVGAIGFRIGRHTRVPIAGITPIEQMLQVSGAVGGNAANSIDHDSAAVLAARAFGRSAPAGFSFRKADAGPDSRPMLQAIETPLVFSGFSPDAVRLFEQHAPSLGLTPVSGLGGASPKTTDRAPIVPGSEISAIIVSGDFNMAASCAVTYVDAKNLLACGHSITRFGDISLPMTKAVVVDTVGSPVSPMKIVNTTETVGSFTEDRASGVLGVFGKPAHMIPVTLTVGGIARPHTYRFAVANHRRLTSGALLATVYQAIKDTNGPNTPSTYDLEGKILLDGYPSVKLSSWIAPAVSKPSSLAAAKLISRRFDRIFRNSGESPPIRGVVLNLKAIPGDRSARLIDAHVLSPPVHTGGQVELEAILRPYRKHRRAVHLSVRLPKTLPPGPVKLLVSGGATLDRTLHLIPNPGAPPQGLRETIARLNALHPTNRLYVTLLAPAAQAVFGGRKLPAIPLSVANVLKPDANGSEKVFAIHGETAIPLRSKELNVAVKGFQVLDVSVRP